MRKIISCIILCTLVVSATIVAQTINTFSVDSVYYIKYKGFALADDKTGLDASGQYTGNEAFTGNEYLRMKTFKEGSWSQMWILNHKGDSYELVNYATNRSIITGRKTPKISTKWSDQDWLGNFAISTKNVYMGPTTTGTSVGLSGIDSYNRFKLLIDDSGGSGRYSISHVWNAGGTNTNDGLMKPVSETDNALFSFDTSSYGTYDFEIVKAAKKSAFIPYDTDLGDFVKPTFDENKRYYIKINDLALTDDKTGLGATGKFSETDIFTGNENLRVKTYDNEDETQMWRFVVEGGEWMIVNHATNRSLWTSQRIPVAGKTWNEAKANSANLQARPALCLNNKVYMGCPSGPDIGWAGWNRYKIRRTSVSSGNYSIVPSFSNGNSPGWDGAMNVLGDTVNAPIGFTGKAIFNIEIIQVSDVATSNTFEKDPILFNITKKMISSETPFDVYNVIGKRIAVSVCQFYAENPGIYMLVSQTNRKVQKVFIR